MRFLCLPGAYGSSDKFQVQLAPILKELTDDGSASFYFIHGPCKAVPPKGFEDFFGKPPYHRFIEPDKDVARTSEDDLLTRIRNFPECETAEDTMRELMSEGVATAHRSTDRAIKYVADIMAKRGPFDGIIGYSEGATVAATMLLYEQRRFKRSGTIPMFKYAIFFAGWPPVDPKSHHLVLADESEERIECRSLHIVGSLDPYIDGSMALYNVCDADTAYLFDHSKGHTLPRDKGTIKELGDVIRDAIADMEDEGIL
ncbi:serine hydrolase FSH [Pseudomassariella vexata]|uniref:Serine hydrolase FSH n=1 Tax=Pseudomassariella vexata TaxID=1141098 RepID=A0A1Y2DEZ1_9PEZI|nr:serine hydrolase FSH [Pseudomassariella vexata]ORY57853.1 serine hydrolase FSH [Pseudomassariella vexata]